MTVRQGSAGIKFYMSQNVYIYNPETVAPKDIQSVEIPEGITEIKTEAFWNCISLRSVTIPDSVTEIGRDAFCDCVNLQSVTIPDSVTKIKASAFSGCANLRSVIIPDSVTEIGAAAFAGCFKLQDIRLSDNITRIRSRTFANCSGLRSVAVPENVTEIGTNAFKGCDNLQTVAIPNNVRKIENSAFRHCSGLWSVLMPDSVTEIGEYAFCDCSGLQSITIPGGVIKIGNSAFEGCSALQSVIIPDSVTEIGTGAFSGCTALQSVTIPDSITEISECIFYGCSRLRSVAIPDGVTKIGDGVFHGCSGLEAVTIPDGVTKIGDAAFKNCGLRSVIMPDSVTKIGDEAFKYCHALQSVTIPDSVTEIGAEAFRNCCDLQSVTLPDSVTKIGARVFFCCSALRTVVLSDNTTEIERTAFLGCSGLQSLMYKGVNIAPFINIDGYGVNTFSVIQSLVEHRFPLSKSTVGRGIHMEHRHKLAEWIREYPVFGEMRLSADMKMINIDDEEDLRNRFADQDRTGHHVPKVLRKLAMTVRICGIPAERLANTFDVDYTKDLIKRKIPLIPGEACRCYYDRSICDALNEKEKSSVMAEAISAYNASGQKEYFRHAMNFIVSHMDTRTEDLRYAVRYAETIPMRAETALTEVRQYRVYMENRAEAVKIEEEYGMIIPGFSLSDYPCNIEPTDVTYGGLTARTLDLSNKADIALAARLGILTNCCQHLHGAGETAMMHGFLNPDAGFWVIEDGNNIIKAQAEIWMTAGGALVFDNIEFANTDPLNGKRRIEQLRGVIAAWAMKCKYRTVIMGCGYNELGTASMEKAPVPKLVLTPEEIFTIQADNDAGVHFSNLDEVREYMQTRAYRPNNFVYTDADEKCVYIKKNGTVSDYLMKGYNRSSAEKRPSPGRKAAKEQDDEPVRQ